VFPPFLIDPIKYPFGGKLVIKALLLTHFAMSPLGITLLLINRCLTRVVPYLVKKKGSPFFGLPHTIHFKHISTSLFYCGDLFPIVMFVVAVPFLVN
jgi:hypothetical protein